MKSKNRKLILWLSIVASIFLLLTTVFLYLVTKSLKRVTYTWIPADLKNFSGPIWNPTNSIPVSPNEAVKTALEYANAQRPKPGSWAVEKIELSRYAPPEVWFYTVTLTYNEINQYDWCQVKILMDRTVWKPIVSGR